MVFHRGGVKTCRVANRIGNRYSIILLFSTTIEHSDGLTPLSAENSNINT